jgi:histidinol dehydrogenase
MSRPVKEMVDMRRVRIEQCDIDTRLRSRPWSDPQVERIVEDVRRRGDEAVREYCLKYDGVRLETFRIPEEKIRSAVKEIGTDLLESLSKAAASIQRFAQYQRSVFMDFEVELEPGVMTGQRIIPLERAGVYVPGGRYPLFSSLLMGVVPARTAGVEQVVVCSPPLADGGLHPALLAAAQISGATEIYAVGGAHAIAALAYGTRSIPPVDKIVGPGNRYVTAAKQIVSGRVGIDLIAGPSEVMIIADEDAVPAYVASDLLAQAEHDPDAIAMLVTTSQDLADRVEVEIACQLEDLGTSDTAQRALSANGLIVLVDRLEEAVEFANRKAPEHLQLCVKQAEIWKPRLRNYGSLFIGPLSAVTLGDYSSGLNHILPTDSSARFTGGLGVKDFLKVQTVLEVDRRGLGNIGPTAVRLARAEGLEAHARAVTLRLEKPEGSKPAD